MSYSSFDMDDEADNVSSDLVAADQRWANRVLAGLNAGVLVFDRSGIVLYVNHRAAVLLEREESSLLGRKLGEVLKLTPAAAAEVSSLERFEFDLLLPNQQVRTIGGTVSKGAGDAQSSLPYQICMFQDITQTRQLRDERDRLLQLGTLHTILPAVLHELRNPLAAIESMVEVLVEDAHDQLRDDLYAILTEVRQMSLNLQGVGSVSRDLRSSTHAAIDRAVLEVVRVMTAKAQEKGISIIPEVQPLPLLPFDPGVVRAIVFNLVDNAIKACAAKAQGEGLVVVRLHLDPTGDLRLEVQDDGCGMDRDVLRRCRELFFSTKPRGSGIGLALCDRTLERAGGSLEIESAVGEGTRVTIRIPTKVPRT
ncbi:MAG: HAMP domain-containing sensor histidine kinase [Myxococcota bacterium]